MCPTTTTVNSGEDEGYGAERGSSADSLMDWRQVAINGGSLRRVDLQTGSNGWASPPGDLFHLRSKGYFSTSRRKKSPSGDWLLLPAGVDWLRSPSRLDHILSRPDNRVAAAFCRRQRRGKAFPFLVAVNLQVPARPEPYSAVFYFASDGPIPPDSLLGRFIHGDDAFRNARFKIVNRIVKGPWIVKAAVGNYAACLLGRALTCRYYKGEDYLEIDVDIGSSAIASAILHLALGYVTAVTIDMGFAVEAQSEEELPEKLFGAVRIAQMEMGSAAHVESEGLLGPAKVNPLNRVATANGDRLGEAEGNIDGIVLNGGGEVGAATPPPLPRLMTAALVAIFAAYVICWIFL